MTNFKNVNGRDLYYLDFGKGTPVVLLHSLGGSGRDWLFQTSSLLKAGFRVIIPDIAGHGGSTLLKEEIGLHDLVKDLWGLLDELEVFETHIVGLSMGGMIALKAAAGRTQRVKKVVLINSSWRTDTEEFTKVLPHWKKQLTNGHGTTEWFEENWQMMVNDAFSNSVVGMQTFQAFYGSSAMSDGESVANVLEGISGIDMTSDLGAIRAPLLLISGGDDPSSKTMMALEGQLPRSKHFIIPRGRHLVNIDSAEKVNEYLVNFFHD